MSVTDRRDDRHLSRHGCAARAPAADARRRRRLALMQAEKIPLPLLPLSLRRRSAASWLWVERLDLADEALAEKIHRDGVEIFVLYANGSPAGYYELDFASPQADEARLFRPDAGMDRHARSGRGCSARRSARGFRAAPSEMLVNTCTLDHPAALPLYQRLGFHPVRRGRSAPQGPGAPIRCPAILLPG